MTLQHGNRVRKTSGNQVVRELKVALVDERGDNGPTQDEIRQRAYEIYLIRNGAEGNTELDWLQAELELRAGKSAAALPNGAIEHV